MEFVEFCDNYGAGVPFYISLETCADFSGSNFALLVLACTRQEATAVTKEPTNVAIILDLDL